MNQAKGEILAVGHVINGKLENWQFNCTGKIPALEVTANGLCLYAGYSIPELEEISKKFWEERGGVSPESEEKVGEATDEGFNIDLTWLDEILKLIDWTTDTAKTWLVNQYKVSPIGTLEEVLKRLTLEQAKEFVHEMQERATKKQPELFE